MLAIAGTLAFPQRTRTRLTAQSMEKTREPQAQRKTITLDLPPEQVEWLDSKAAGIMSRSAFARSLISAAMKADG